MNSFFIPKELADKLKAKSYPMPTNVVYATYKRDGKLCPMKIVGGAISKEPVAPTIEQVLKWLREEKKLFVEPSLFKYGYESYIQSTTFEDDKDYTDTWYVEGFYSTYEQAALAGIEYVIDNLI